MKAFLDSDVILDFLLNRNSFVEEITQIIQLSIDTGLVICVSPITITNVHYIIGRLEDKKSADIKTRKIIKLVTIENVGETTIHKAMFSKFKDFEDGLQHFCAVESEHQVIVTRNVKDYKASELAVQNPKEFLSGLLTG